MKIYIPDIGSKHVQEVITKTPIKFKQYYTIKYSTKNSDNYTTSKIQLCQMLSHYLKRRQKFMSLFVKLGSYTKNAIHSKLQAKIM